MFGNRDDEARSRARHPTAHLFDTETTTTSSFVIEARYDGVCDWCGEEIYVGDELIQDEQTEQWIHGTHGE